MNTATAQKPRKDAITTTGNFGDFQFGVYGEALRGVSSRYPFDYVSNRTQLRPPVSRARTTLLTEPRPAARSRR